MNKVDWTKAPEGAEFYAGGKWFKRTGTALLSFSDGEWTEYVGLLANQMIKALQKEPDYQQRPEKSTVKHYTGQMTKEELKNVKFKFKDEEQCDDFIFMCTEADVSSFVAALDDGLYAVTGDVDGLLKEITWEKEMPEIKSYTGQMTADQLKNTKIRTLSPEHSKAFQEMCFEVGIGWFAGRKTVSFEGNPFLYIKNKEIKFGSDESCFSQNANDEIAWQHQEAPSHKQSNSIKITSSNGRTSEDPDLKSMGGNIEAWAHWLLGADIYQMIEGNEQKVSMPNFNKDNCYVWRYNKESIKEQQKDTNNDLPPLGFTINGYELEAYNKDFTKAFLTKGKEVITLDVEDAKHNYDLDKYEYEAKFIIKASNGDLSERAIKKVLYYYEKYKQQ